MDGGAAEAFGRDGLVGDGLHHVRSGDEHVGGVAHHEDEVGHGGRIDVAAGARTHDDRYLRDDARRQHVALENLGITAERGDALLDARAAGVVDADDRRAVPERHVLYLHHLLGMRLGQRTAEDGEVLGEEVDRAAVDRAPAGDDAVAGDLLLFHAEIGRAVLDEHVELLEGAFVEEDFDALARSELAAFVLGVDARLAAAHPGDLAAALQFLQHVLHGESPYSDRRSTAVWGRKRGEGASAWCALLQRSIVLAISYELAHMRRYRRLGRISGSPHQWDWLRLFSPFPVSRQAAEKPRG